MDKREFLEELEERLVGVAKEDREDILQDYEEHFKAGKKKRRSEQEISKSLGEPKEIAREIRKELSGRREGSEELKTEAIETWVALKKFSKYIFNETREKIDEIQSNFNPKKVSHWIFLILGIVAFFIVIGFLSEGLIFILILLVLILLIDKFIRRKNKKGQLKKSSLKKKSGKKEKRRDKSTWKTVLILLFNVLVFVWIWLCLFCTIIAFFIIGIAIVLSGLLLIAFSVFYLIRYSNPLLNDLFFSELFAGIGLGILGVLFVILFDKLIKGFFILTGKYLKLNQRLIKK